MTFCGIRFHGRYWQQSGHAVLRRTRLLLTQKRTLIVQRSFYCIAICYAFGAELAASLLEWWQL